MKTDIILKTLVINSEGKLLLLRRSETDVRRPLQWDFPGGHLDAGESIEEGAIREVLEESGLSVKLNRPLFTKTEIVTWKDSQGEQTRNVIWIYFSSFSDGDAKVKVSNEHNEYAWIEIKEALNLIQYPRHKEVIQHILDNKLEL